MVSPAKRITYLDWLRGLAAIAVVLLHELNMVLTEHAVAELGVPLVLSWTWLQIVLTRWAVPVFLMVSGALLLDPGRDVTWEKPLRAIVRMMAVLAVFCPVYACVSARAVTPGAIVDGLVGTLTHNSWDHLWYVYALMGLYLLTPMLASYVRTASEGLQRATLLALAVPTLLVATVNRATGSGIATVGWVSSSVFYYLLGSYAHRHLTLDGVTRALGLAALAAALALAAWCVLVRSWYPGWLIRPECPLVALWSLLVFLAAKAACGGRAVPAPLAWASEHSLALYLVHPILLVVLYRRLMWMPYETLPPVAFEVAVLVIVLGTSGALATLARRLPLLGTIL